MDKQLDKGMLYPCPAVFVTQNYDLKKMYFEFIKIIR